MDYDSFAQSLDWRPISEYDRTDGDAVMLRDADHVDAGYFSELEIHVYDDRSTDYGAAGEPLPDTSPMFRMAQDWREGQPLGWEPVEFAIGGFGLVGSTMCRRKVNVSFA